MSTTAELVSTDLPVKRALYDITYDKNLRLALTPEGALYAFSCVEPNAEQVVLQGLMTHQTLVRCGDWVGDDSEREQFCAHGLTKGWLHQVARNPSAPDVKLDDFLPHVIGSLSSLRQVALASTGGFCVGQTGYSHEQAEALCVAAADFSEFARRQRTRGWQGASHMASFHEDIAMLMPTTSFVPFWVDGNDFCLVLGGEPLLNNPALIELIWGIKSAGSRFTAKS